MEIHGRKPGLSTHCLSASTVVLSTLTKGHSGWTRRHVHCTF